MSVKPQIKVPLFLHAGVDRKPLWNGLQDRF
jgi:hypothetical protein